MSNTFYASFNNLVITVSIKSSLKTDKFRKVTTLYIGRVYKGEYVNIFL